MSPHWSPSGHLGRGRGAARVPSRHVRRGGRDARSEALGLLADQVDLLRLQDFEAIGAAMAADQATELPELLADEGLRHTLQSANRDHVMTLLPSLPADPWVPPEMPTASPEVVRTLARRSARLSVVLQLFRIGSRFLRTRFGLELVDGVRDLVDARAGGRPVALGLGRDQRAPGPRHPRRALARLAETFGDRVLGPPG